MARFILNKNQQANGDFEVHNKTTGCSYMPSPENQVDLGEHISCHGAVLLAKQNWPTARINGCYYCCRSCHTT
ncbi:hypothetical protein [Comamonas sp.]|uniref:hypothetical protein n=1 Tax=Comamonas sp. TaxID=34028 RepID=UPI0028A77525|nr:hypothetical protein [Comamonas sp.]